MDKVKVGIVGCGNISRIYLTNLPGMFADTVQVEAVCDMDLSRAQAAAETYHVPKAYGSVEELLEDESIELVVNLTTPGQHCTVNLMALEHGRHVYCEKPLAINREDGLRQVALAKEKGLLLGCAPDTFMGAGLQTCRKLIDDGEIGDVVAVNASMHSHGPEHWHPAPDFFYKTGGGPMFDMGPYYLTAMVALAGQVESVSAYTRITFPQRKITSQPNYGKMMEVEVPTHIAGVMRFASGAIGSLTTTFDVYDDHQACLEIYGTRGSLRAPDPNTFGGKVQLLRAGESAYTDVPLTHGYAENSRGLGVADMCHALRENRTARADAQLGMHVLDLMCAFHDAAREGRQYTLNGGCVQPKPLSVDERL